MKKNQWSYTSGLCITSDTDLSDTFFHEVSACSDCLKLVLTVWFSYSSLISYMTSAILFPFFSPRPQQPFWNFLVAL